jgi:hypothetical protein
LSLFLSFKFPCSQLCQAGGLDPQKVKGKILACLRGINARVDKARQAFLAGAVGMILANAESNGNEIIADSHVLPATHINYTDGQQLFAYIKRTKYIFFHFHFLQSLQLKIICSNLQLM